VSEKIFPEKPDLDSLKHYGVKGMKWGVINEDRGSDRKKNSKDETSNNPKAKAQYAKDSKKIREEAEKAGLDSENLRAKYGAPPQKTGLTPEQKQAIFYAAVGVAAIGYVGYAGYKNRAQTASLFAGQNSYLNAKNGLDNHWESGVSLKAGSFVHRISSTKESSIRDGGFFAAYKPEDVERYKAVLPGFWQSWGMGDANKGGFKVNLKAKTEIKAPSGKESVEVFRNLLLKNPQAFIDINAIHKQQGSNRDLRDILKNNDPKDQETTKALFQAFSLYWTEQGAKATITQAYFRDIKARGYNALIDFNDSGKLADAPLRLLDGKAFEIDSVDDVSATDIYKSAKTLLETLQKDQRKSSLAAAKEELFMNDSSESLTHYGVKGMKWGVRDGKSKTGVSRFASAKVDQNKRTADMLTKARSGEKYKLNVAIGKKLIGKEQWERNFQTSMRELNAQNERLLSGKATVADKLNTAMSVTPLELLVSVRPKD